MTTFIVYQTDNKLGVTRLKEINAANHKHAVTSYLTAFNRQEKVMQLSPTVYDAYKRVGRPIFIVYEKAKGEQTAQYYITR